MNYQTVSERFVAQFGYGPDSVWKSPGRVNIIGDHTDYQGGYALPIAIPYATYVAARLRRDGVIDVASDYQHQHTILTPFERRNLLRSQTPLSGLEGFVTAVWDLTEAQEGADILIVTTLPIASGLSSSTALSLGLLATAQSLAGREAETSSLISDAQEIENRYLGVSSGILDPMAIVMTQAGTALWINAGNRTSQRVPFDYAQDGYALWIVDTKTPRTLAESGYDQRVRETQMVCRALGIRNLSEADWGSLEHLQDPVLQARGRHVLSENERVVRTVHSAGMRRWSEVKQLLLESHRSLAHDFAVSTHQLDTTVKVIASVDMGARLTGAGFGGSVIAFGESQQEGDLVGEVTRLYAREGWEQPSFLSVPSPVQGLERLK